MKPSNGSWNRVGSLRDKVTLVRCHDWILGFEARYVRQVGFADLIEDWHAEAAGCGGHVGRGVVGDAPCSVWDLGLHLGLGPMSRAVVVLERPGGVVAFRCDEVLSVEAVAGAQRLPLPAALTARAGLCKALLLLSSAEEGRQRIGYLLRASALFGGNEMLQIHRDWSTVKLQGARS